MRPIRICRINRTGYGPVFDDLYARDPGLRDMPSQVQAERYFGRFLVYGDSFSREMRARGHEAIEILCNAEYIQKAWAREYGVSYRDESWVREIVLAQIAEMRPDVVFIQGISTDPFGFLPEGSFRRDHPFVKLVVAYSGFPHDMNRFGGVDVVVSGAPQLVEHYQRRGLQTPLVYHAFDTGVLDALEARGGGEPLGFVFTGLSGVGFGAGHLQRYWDLVRLILETDIEPFVYDRLEELPEQIPAEAGRTLAANLRAARERATTAEIIELLQGLVPAPGGKPEPLFPLSMLFPDRCHVPVFGIDMFEVLRRARVVFNRHTNALGRPAFGNIRVFEATGVGACLLTDFTDDGRALFEPDAEIVTFASVDEAIEKAAYLRDHEGERAAIAAAGHRRTMAQHTARHRVEQIDDIIQEALAGKPVSRAV